VKSLWNDLPYFHKNPQKPYDHMRLQNQRAPSLRVAINAQITPDLFVGGMQSALTGLINSLGKLTDGDEEYIIIGPQNNWEWLEAYIGRNQRVVPGFTTGNRSLHRFVNRIRRAYWKIRKADGAAAINHPERHEVPISSGFYESLGCQVLHFPYQHYTVCTLPSIYNPHDLQHLHYPQFFTAAEIAYRETIYRAGCDLSRTVVVGSQWIKQDVTDHYHINPKKIQVIPWAAPTLVYASPTSELLKFVNEKHKLTPPFAFYPAATWEHKNHIRLLEALAYLRDRETLKVNLVCTGALVAFWPKVEQTLRDLNLNDQVKFLGIVPSEELRAIYKMSQFVVVPSLFEAASGPVFEAWQEDAPACCSNVTSLPQQVGEAALIFDPFSIGEIAKAVKKMATDDEFRNQLVAKGIERRKVFSWEKTAKAYRAVYRRAGKRPLSEEDQYLLGWDWMSAPNHSEETLHE
jgi:glycosyltransferase involved in cell wall biosynthesis